MSSILLSFSAGIIFIFSYIAIALEHSLKISKSAVALVAGSLLWILAALNGGEHLDQEIIHAASDVFSIVIFLLAAMALVEVLVHYRFFDVIRGKLYAWKLSDKGQFLVIAVLAFFLSAVIDNLTTTIIMIQISRRFFRGDNLLYAAAAIVIAANAGGAFSPIGDVTTIMLWFADKFGSFEIISKGFLPSLVLFGVAAAFLCRKIKPSGDDSQEEVITKLSRSEKLVITLVFLSFGLPLVMSIYNLPPYMGLLLGLGVIWVLIDSMKRIVPRKTHLDASIEEFIKKTDIASLKFFVGILLAVAALDSLGVLHYLANFIYGETLTTNSLIIGNVALGLLSAILDNVPLTAIAIQMLNTTDTGLWVLLALTVGTGGSLLVIGSAAGVVAMGMVKELTFSKYFKLAFVPALWGYVAAVSVWAIQYFWLGW